MAKLTLPEIYASRASIASINAAFEAIEQWSDTVLSRDGSSPNQLEEDFDFNSNWGINVPLPVFNHHVASKEYVDYIFGQAVYGEQDTLLIQGLQDQIESNDGDIAARATITYVDQVIATEQEARATSITALEAEITQNSTDIASRATITYVDSVSATLTGAIATSETTITAAYQAADTTLQTDINTRATVSYVDTSIATVNTAIASSESTLRAEYQGADLRITAVNSNLVQNPTGADGVNGWTNTTNWTTDSSAIGQYFITTSTGTQTINSVEFGVQANQAYNVQFRSGGLTFTAGSCNIIWKNSGGSTISTDSISITSQDSYPLYSDSFVAPATATQALVQFTANISSGFFLFQKVKVEQADAATMFTDDIYFVNTLAEIQTNSTAIASNTSSIATVETTLRAEYQAADLSLQTDINTRATVTYVDSAVATESSARASADSTLTASIGANTSSISTNATAIATVDGKLSAKYALTVDANGRIAQMALLSDGTTSEVKFKADTFKIFDGSSADIAPFSVSGGVVTMTNVRITGDLIVDNAISEFQGNEDATSTTLVKDTWVTVASQSVTTNGGRAIVNASCYVGASATTAVFTECRIRRGSTTIFESGALPSINDLSGGHYTAGIVPVTTIDEPSAGTYTYTFEIYVDVQGAGALVGSAVATDKTIYVQEFKK